MSCEPRRRTPTTTLQKSEVSSDRFMTVAEEPAARRWVASRYLVRVGLGLWFGFGFGFGFGFRFGLR